MIGAWSKFGEGLLPCDGEAIVFIQPEYEVENLFDPNFAAEAVLAIYRRGMVTTQSGWTCSLPYGSYWTSIPSPKNRA